VPPEVLAETIVVRGVERGSKVDVGGGLRQIASGGDRTVPQGVHQVAQRRENSLVPLA